MENYDIIQKKKKKKKVKVNVKPVTKKEKTFLIG